MSTWIDKKIKYVMLIEGCIMIKKSIKFVVAAVAWPPIGIIYVASVIKMEIVMWAKTKVYGGSQ